MRRRLAGNVVWNWAGMGVNMLAGFILAPYLVNRLGDTVYGIWILIASMSGYFGLLDLGVRGSVGRYIAYYLARGEQEKVNATISTAVTILSAVALLALLATLAVLLLFFHVFAVPPEHVQAARWAILIIGVNLALTFPISVFDGVLWGHERFDLLNILDVPTAIARVALTFWLVKGPPDILALAWITLGTTAASETAKLIASFRVDRELRMSVKLFRREQAGQLYGYGLWQFLLQIARQVSGQIGPLLIGWLVSVAAVTPFSLASRLINYSSQFMVAATGVLTPLATALHARDDGVRERQLFVEGGRWCTVFALYAGIGMLLLGKPLLILWVKGTIAASAAPVLMVLVAGELLPMSQWLTYSIILGKARHRAVALASLAEGVIAGVGGMIAARYWGTMGVCVVFAAAGVLCRGVFQIVYACRVIGVPVWKYVDVAILRPVLVALLPGAVLGVAVIWRSPASWLEFVVYGVGFSLIFGGTALWMLGAAKYLLAQWAGGWRAPAVENVHG